MLGVKTFAHLYIVEMDDNDRSLSSVNGSHIVPDPAGVIKDVAGGRGGGSDRHLTNHNQSATGRQPRGRERPREEPRKPAATPKVWDADDRSFGARCQTSDFRVVVRSPVPWRESRAFVTP